MADLRRIYIDSCSFIEMVKVAVGKAVTTDRESDVWHLKRLLEASRDREIEAFTSTLTIAECIHVGDHDVSEETKNVFAALLTSGQYVRLVQATPFICEDARNLRWVHGVRGLRGADGIHIASALDRGCEEFLTTNGRLQRLTPELQKLATLGIRVTAGRMTLCLPDKYRQLGLTDIGAGDAARPAGPGVH